jgi:hypothetical protein
MNPFYDIIDPESLDYSRGVKIIRDESGKLQFVPKLNEKGEPLSDLHEHKTSNAESS